jgi:uncharacterized protein
MSFLLKTSKRIELRIEEFLHTVTEASILFHKALENYLAERTDDFEERFAAVSELEGKADTLRREVETDLYVYTLIPEARGDVLGLLENTDNVIDQMKETLTEFSTETPDVPEQFHVLMIELCRACMDSVEALVQAVRCFFKDIVQIDANISRVRTFEKEADRIAVKLKREIFQSDLALAHKIHLRYFTLHIERISDLAESVADRLMIYAIKRQI